MARRAITMTERIETIIHWNAGQPVKAIVQSLGIARNTVRKYVRLAIRSGLRQGDPLPSREALVEILDRPESRTSFESPATSLLVPFHATLESFFEDKDMTAKQAWRLLQRDYGLRVGYTTIKEYVRTHIRRVGRTVTIRMETPPGHQAQDRSLIGWQADQLSGCAASLWTAVPLGGVVGYEVSTLIGPLLRRRSSGFRCFWHPIRVRLDVSSSGLRCLALGRGLHDCSGSRLHGRRPWPQGHLAGLSSVSGSIS